MIKSFFLERIYKFLTIGLRPCFPGGCSSTPSLGSEGGTGGLEDSLYTPSHTRSPPGPSPPSSPTPGASPPSSSPLGTRTWCWRRRRWSTSLLRQYTNPINHKSVCTLLVGKIARKQRGVKGDPIELYVQADFLDLREVVEECAGYIEERIGEENVLSVWQLAQTYRLPGVQKAALRSPAPNTSHLNLATCHLKHGTCHLKPETCHLPPPGSCAFTWLNCQSR